jgi:hypothetical protein
MSIPLGLLFQQPVKAADQQNSARKVPLQNDAQLIACEK